MQGCWGRLRGPILISVFCVGGWQGFIGVRGGLVYGGVASFLYLSPVQEDWWRYVWMGPVR